MPSPHLRAVVMLSVATEPLSSHRGRKSASAAVVESLARSLRQASLVTTWISASPIESPHAALVASLPRHELALGATPQVLAAGRPAFGEELRRQVLRARAGGIVVSTLFANDAAPAEHQDLLVKHGIGALATVASATESGSDTGALRRASRWILPLTARAGELPQKLRWGLYQMPAPLSLVHQGKWRVRQAVDRTVASGGLVHLHADLATIEAAGRRKIEELESVLRQIDAYQLSGRIATRSAREVTAALAPQRAAAPACSILRKRAA